MRADKELEEPLRSFLKEFEPRNPLKLENLKLSDKAKRELDRESKLIYASFGTLANQDMKAYLNVIEAVKTFDQVKNSSGI